MASIVCRRCARLLNARMPMRLSSGSGGTPVLPLTALSVVNGKKCDGSGERVAVTEPATGKTVTDFGAFTMG